MGKKTTSPAKATISNETKVRVMMRDQSTCQLCGKNVMDNRIKVCIDHIIPICYGGSNDEKNLQVLCKGCFDGKQKYVAKEDPTLVMELNKATSTEERLKLYFENHENERIASSVLASVAKERSWTRQLRSLRAKGMNIEFQPKNKAAGLPDGYIYKK